MPKFPRGFGRRKSSANVLEDIPNVTVPEQPTSFKVFERPEKAPGNRSFDGGNKFTKATNGHGPRPRTSHLQEDNMFVNLGNNRGSGASNTNTASTADNSSRLSAASTAPSSTVDLPGQEYRSPHDKPFSNIPIPPIPKPSSAFSLKNAGRTLSWTRNKNSALPAPPREPSSPTIDKESAGRARAVTASSYASTATPPKIPAENDLGLSLGGDFADMFSGFGKRKSQILEASENRTITRSPETIPSGPSRFNQPSALHIDRNKQASTDIISPNSFTSQNSKDGLISNESPPAVPQHGNASTRRPQRPVDGGIRRSSGYSGKRQSTIEYDGVDEDARLLRESVNASRRMNDPSYSKARDSWINPSTSLYPAEEQAHPNWRAGSVETTPKAKKVEPRSSPDDNLFDNHMLASVNASQRFQDQPISPPTAAKNYNAPPQNKVMTPAQFEKYRQDQERLQSFGAGQKPEEEDEEETTYDDDEDEAEKNRQLAKQRRKQEAHMSVYRQQMMKVTGETTDVGPPRASLFATQSSPNLALPEENEEEDEEVPLAILQAHGFPNKNKPPMRSSGSNPNLRGAQSASLPVFARNLPQDPYLGAGLVNPMQRESLSFGGGAGSVHGGSHRGAPPGGLVGVIATEEKARAARRGSPNTQGGYDLPPGGFMGIPPGMPNGMHPGAMHMGPMGPIPGMMLTPGDQAQIQMSQQMQQFMAMQMQFMQMMTAGGQGQQPPPPNGHLTQQSMSIPGAGSPSFRPESPHQRAMSILDPNAAPWMQNRSMYTPSVHAQGLGYAPSIAPSERSNIGLPGRYRPVTHIPPPDAKSRTSTMSGALQNWDAKKGPTVKAVVKSGNASDEDDESAWQEMAKKREKKKSSWRTKKDTNGLKEMLGYQ